MKKKVLSVLLVGVLAVGALAGCGSKKSSSSSGSKDKGVDTSKEGEHELSVYAWDKNFNIPALKAAEKAYQTKDPDFKLNIIEQGQSSDVENAITKAGTANDFSKLPDIVLFQDHYIHKYVSDYPDAFQTVDDSTADWANLSAEKISYSTIDGKHYGFPVDNGAVITAYRTDLLEKAGYTVDQMKGISWDEFIEIGKKVKEATKDDTHPDGYYLLSMDGSGNDLVYMMLQAEGSSQFDEKGNPVLTSNEKVYQICDLIVKMQKAGVLDLAQDWNEYTNKTIVGDQVAGVINGNWIIPTMKQVNGSGEGGIDNTGKWALTTMPTLEGNGKEGYASNGGSSLYLTAACKKADLAKDFLSYTFGGGEGAKTTYDEALKNGGVIGTWANATSSEVYSAPDAFFGGAPIYSTIVEMGTKVPTVNQSDYHYATREQVGNAIQAAINGDDLKSALKDAEDQVKTQIENGSNK